MPAVEKGSAAAEGLLNKVGRATKYRKGLTITDEGLARMSPGKRQDYLISGRSSRPPEVRASQALRIQNTAARQGAALGQQEKLALDEAASHGAAAEQSAKDIGQWHVNQLAEEQQKWAKTLSDSSEQATRQVQSQLLPKLKVASCFTNRCENYFISILISRNIKTCCII